MTHVNLLCFKINHLERLTAQLFFLTCHGIRPGGDTSVLYAPPPPPRSEVCLFTPRRLFDEGIEFHVFSFYPQAAISLKTTYKPPSDSLCLTDMGNNDLNPAVAV